MFNELHLGDKVYVYSQTIDIRRNRHGHSVLNHNSLISESQEFPCRIRQARLVKDAVATILFYLVWRGRGER